MYAANPRIGVLASTFHSLHVWSKFNKSLADLKSSEALISQCPNSWYPVSVEVSKGDALSRGPFGLVHWNGRNGSHSLCRIILDRSSSVCSSVKDPKDLVE